MATTPRPRPCTELDVHDDHSHCTTAVLGELSLNKVHSIRHKGSVEDPSRRLDDLQILHRDKEYNSSFQPEGGAASRDPVFEGAQEPKPLPEPENGNPLALASQQARSTKEQLLRHQEGQFEWLLSIPVQTAAKGRRPRGDSDGDAGPGRGGKTLYFGCNLVKRKPQSDGKAEDGESTDVYTLLATRVKAEEDFIIERAPVLDEMEAAAAADQARLGDDAGASKVSPEPVAEEVNGVASASDNSGEHSRPLSRIGDSPRIEDSVEALDKLEEEIEAVAEVAQLERVLSPEPPSPTSHAGSAKSTPVKRATSVRTPPASAKSKTAERTSSVRNNKTSSSGDDERATTSSGRRVPRPASLLPPKPLAKSTKAPTTPNFELPGEAVARQLKERRAQRLSQQISPEQAAATAAAYSPSRPHVKSTKPLTRPSFELPGEAISRRKREKREAELRAREEEERKRREFKARPIRANLVPTTVPRETLASLARQKARASTEGSADSGSTTVTPVSKKRQSATVTTPSSALATRTTPGGSGAATLPMRGRNPTASRSSDSAGQPASPARRAASTSSSTAASTHSRASRVSAEEAAQQKLRGKEVFRRDNSLAAERERERRERERAAKEAREKAAERSRELSRQWAEKQRLKKKEAERRRAGGEEAGAGAASASASSPSPIATATITTPAAAAAAATTAALAAAPSAAAV
ncbi:hypothetical protein VTH06DRAFT_1730 [Thermothelomyces fergusii]